MIQIKNKSTGKIILELETLVCADLSSTDLSHADLRSADLRHANLSSANLSCADLCFADLCFANLSFANLSFANLSCAELRYTDLRYTDLSSADLRSADLSSADLRSADLRYIKNFILGPQRTDGYLFVLNFDGTNWLISEGCRIMSFSQYRQHIKTYDDIQKQKETSLILDFLEKKLELYLENNNEKDN